MATDCAIEGCIVVPLPGIFITSAREYSSSLSKFLQGGGWVSESRYEIKFLVDGEWQVSSELPTLGEGVTMNNLLVVD